MKNIKIRSASKKYGNLLRYKNIEFLSGNNYHLTGKNGSGKTTLLTCLAGINNFTEFDGEIGSDVKIWFGNSDSIAFPNILGCDLITDDSIFSPKELFLEEFIDKRCDSYSKGMQSKAKLLSISKRHNIIILDEALDSVDQESLKIIWKKLNRLKKVTIILVQHQNEVLLNNLQKIVLK